MLPKNQKYKCVPPDGGYGYVICISMVTMVTCCISHLTCFGMIYNDFFVKTGTTVGMITVIQAVAAIVVSVTGIIANVAVKRFNMRRVAMVGSFMYITGWFCNIFVNSAYQMIFSIGILEGTGIGTLLPIVFTSFNAYFEKKRVMMMSICQVAIGIGAMIYPLFLEKLLDVYGFRGTLLIQTGIVMNTFFGAITLHPVKWHSVEVLIYEVAQDELMVPKNIPMNQLKDVNNFEKDENFTYGNIEKNGRFLVQNVVPNYSIKSSENDSHNDSDNINSLPKNGLWKRFVKLIDLDLLSDYVLLNIMFGVSIGVFTDMCFGMLLPLFLFSTGLNTSNVANCLSVMAGADLLSRLFLVILSKFYTFKSRNLFFYVLIATGIARIIFVECKQYWTFMLMACVMGFLRGLLNIPINLVYAEYIPEKFIAAYGLSAFFVGNISSILNPLMGLLKDATNSFAVVFYTLSFISLFCIVPWIIEFWYFKRKSRYNK